MNFVQAGGTEVEVSLDPEAGRLVAVDGDSEVLAWLDIPAPKESPMVPASGIPVHRGKKWVS